MALKVEIIEEDRDYWGNSELEYNLEMEMEERHDLTINIWTKTFKDKRAEYQNYYNGDKCQRKEVSLHYQSETKRLMLITDKEKYFASYFVCKNRESKCFFTFRNKKSLQEHELLCGVDKVRIVQTEMGPSETLIERAVKAGLIPQTQHRRDFLFYDIEAVLTTSNVRTSKTTVLSTHSVVSVAVNR